MTANDKDLMTWIDAETANEKAWSGLIKSVKQVVSRLLQVESDISLLNRIKYVHLRKDVDVLINEVGQLQVKMDVLWTDYQQRKQIEDDLK